MATGRWRAAASLALAAVLLGGCASDGSQAGAESAGSPEQTPEAPQSQAACGEIEASVDGGIVALEQLDPVDALDSIPELSWIASAMQLPQMRDLFAERSDVTIFAPLDGAQGDDEDTQADDDTARDVQAPPQAFIHPEAALGLEQLLAGSPISVADGGQLEVSIEGDRAWLLRDDARVEIVCADLVLDGAVLHVTDGIPFGSTAGAESTEADADPDRQYARDPTTQPDPSNDEAGTSP